MESGYQKKRQEVQRRYRDGMGILSLLIRKKDRHVASESRQNNDPITDRRQTFCVTLPTDRDILSLSSSQVELEHCEMSLLEAEAARYLRIVL